MFPHDLMNLGSLTLAKATPLLLATYGGLLSESAGVINFALEGMMLSGAFGAVWATFATGSPWMGLLAGACAGIGVGILHGLACLVLRANPIVSSIALNLLAAGLTGLLLHEVFQAYGTSPTVAKLPVLQKAFFEAVPIAGGLLAGLLGELSVVVLLAFVLAAGLMIWFRRSASGLRLRACGENPEAADAAGLSVFRIRYTAVLCSGLLAGVGGAYLSIGELSQFVENMTQGRGYLAIAALILARWRPVGVLLAALLFGFSEALSEWLAVLRPQFPSQAFLAFPYLISLAVLATQMSRKRPPSALGQLK